MLLATTNESLTNALSFLGGGTIAAATGTTLDVNGSDTISDSSFLVIGLSGEDGTIRWHGDSTEQGANVTVQVAAGTLMAGDEGFSNLLGSAVQTTVEAGATIDLAGFSTAILNLTGLGEVIDSGAAATLILGGAVYAGTISGPLSLIFNGDASLNGLEDYTGSATVASGFSVTNGNGGTYDLVANTNVNGTSTSNFINKNLFEKTGGGGVSDVTSNFVNSGTLNVLSGSIAFSGGFSNTGVIHGLVTRARVGILGRPPEATVSAAVPSDFNGDSRSDILWQNVSGQASIWDMNGNSLVGGGAVSPNPGSNWKAIGAGDFNGDGLSDILFQNTSSGQASIWEMDGNALTGGGADSLNPGPAWQAIGTGDFNGDGLADILWQNTSSGEVSIWEMNGDALIGGGSVSPNPGPAWKAIGTGDFNGDSHSDILFQNTSTGQVSIWEMNGNSLIGGGPVSPNPGPAWKAIGTGDFNHDGHSDILFQNTSSGQVSIWEMNGNTLTGGGPVSPNPGLSWHAVGTGDFNGDGYSDILFQNTSGQASVWEMNGASLIGGGPVSPNWRAVA
jgi:FG-GAP-like repeat